MSDRIPSPTLNKIYYKTILDTVMLIIENELFPTIGLPYETLRKRYIDIPNNLMDIRVSRLMHLHNSAFLWYFFA